MKNKAVLECVRCRFSRNSSLCSMEFFINDDIIDAYSKLQNQQYPFIFKAQGADFAKRSK